MRHDGREFADLREITIEVNKYLYSDSSVELHLGKTQVVCSVKISGKVAPNLVGTGNGELIVHYHVAPFATEKKVAHDDVVEAEHFISRALASSLDFSKMSEQSVVLDCTVLQDDGGADVASITAGFLALAKASQELVNNRILAETPVVQNVAAISVGILPDGKVVTDLDAVEEKQTVAQLNMVMTDAGAFVARDVTTKGAAIDGRDLNALLLHGKNGLEELIALQKETLIETEAVLEDNELLIATGNPGKAREFAEMFAPMGFTIKTLADFPNLPEVEETGTTFVENARLKAETIARLTQRPVIADDSGLSVVALDGLPGIFSARYAGPAKNPASNNAKLLASLFGVPAGHARLAAFHCALAVAAPDAETLTVEATWSGEIATIPSGDDGFGYDPLFYVPELGKTAAELTPAQKNKISHRAKALALLKEKWPAWWESANR